MTRRVERCGTRSEDSPATTGQSGDPLHDHGEQRAEHVRSVIESIPKDGGSRSDLGPDAQLECHRQAEAHGAGWGREPYGRMAWDGISSTITGGCVNPSKGRFLHPDEDRAITLREALLLQGFPPDHRLSLKRGKYAAAELVGNAIPPAVREGTSVGASGCGPAPVGRRSRERGDNQASKQSWQRNLLRSSALRRRTTALTCS